MEAQLAKEIDNSITALMQVLSSIDQAKINLVPFEGSWTAGQLAKHMIMSNSGFAELINGNVKETSRKPDEFIEGIRSSFLDFSHKFESPDFVRPPAISYDKHELVQSLNAIKKRLIETLKVLDLTKTCIDFEIPVLGYLTRLEAAHFVLYHTQRHTHQLKNIATKLKTGYSMGLAKKIT